MDETEEIRMLRETITSLQWALVQTLKHLETMGNELESESDVAAQIKALRREIMQLQSSSPSQQILREQEKLMQRLKRLRPEDNQSQG